MSFLFRKLNVEYAKREGVFFDSEEGFIPRGSAAYHLNERSESDQIPRPLAGRMPLRHPRALPQGASF